MRNRVTRSSAALLIGALLSFGAIAQTEPPPPEAQYSGFLRDYSQMQATQDSQGSTVLRKTNPRFTPQNYKAVMLEKLTFYPEPQPTEAVSAQTLKGIAEYAQVKFQQALLKKKVQIVESPGPGVARIKLAITSVVPEKEGYKPYQYIPIAFIVTTAKRTAGGAPKQARLMIEALVTDAASGEELMGVVREGKGERLDADQVTLESLKPLIDKWMEGAANEIPKYLAPSR